MFPIFATGVVDISGKFTPMSLIQVANLQLVTLTLAANLPLVSLILVVFLDLQNISGMLEKFRKDPKDIFEGLGEDDS